MSESRTEEKTCKLSRRDFFGFFVFGGLLSLLAKKAKTFAAEDAKKAMFWRKKDEA